MRLVGLVCLGILAGCGAAAVPAARPARAVTPPTVPAPSYELASRPRPVTLPERRGFAPMALTPFAFLPEEEPDVMRDERERGYWDVLWRYERDEVLAALPPRRAAMTAAQLDELARAPRVMFQNVDGVCRRWLLRATPVADPRSGGPAHMVRWSRVGKPYRARDGALHRTVFRSQLIVHEGILTDQPDDENRHQTWDASRRQWVRDGWGGGVTCFVPEALSVDGAGTVRVGSHATLYRTRDACLYDRDLSAELDPVAIAAPPIATLVWRPAAKCREDVVLWM